MKKVAGVVVLGAALWLAGSYFSGGKEGKPSGRVVRLATTTSVVDSGLLGVLLPRYEEKEGVRVEVAAVGSGEALARLGRGEADVAIVHALDDRWSGRRTVVWRNDFVLVGPKDAASIVAGAGAAVEALRRVAASGRPFVSRGDDSGTHHRERELFARAGVTPKTIVAKAGMGKTLERADAEDAFTLSDRATFVAKKKSLDLAILFQEDEALINEYAVLEREDASLSTFLLSDEARARVGGFGVAQHGEALFTPAPRP